MEIKVLTADLRLFFRIAPFLVKAFYDNKTPLTLKELSEISGYKLKNNLLSRLCQERIIQHVTNGKKTNTGYVFYRDPKEISALEIIEAMQGLPYVRCTSELYEKTGKVCPVCEAMQYGIDKVVELAKDLTLYDYVRGINNGGFDK